jgi:hypothetical protein
VENILNIRMGEGDHIPGEKRNSIPIELELCTDSRKDECPFYMQIAINTNEVSFHQGFCGWRFRKGL